MLHWYLATELHLIQRSRRMPIAVYGLARRLRHCGIESFILLCPDAGVFNTTPRYRALVR